MLRSYFRLQLFNHWPKQIFPDFPINWTYMFVADDTLLIDQEGLGGAGDTKGDCGL